MWKDIDELYEVSDDGEVRRKKDGKILKQYTQKSGYNAVYLKDKNGWVGARMVHRLVAMAFLPIIQDKPYVDHINTIRSDNRLCNLRWASPLDNSNNETTKFNRKKLFKMTKEDYLKLPKERLAELLVERDLLDAAKQEINGHGLPTVQVNSPCLNPDSPCMNPFHDCINCPRQFSSGGYVKTTTTNVINY